MRVLVVNHAVGLGGAELTLLDLLMNCPDYVTVEVALPGPGPLWDRLEENGCRVVRAGPGNTALSLGRASKSAHWAAAAAAVPGLLPGLARLASRAREADLVVTNSTKAHIYGTLAARLSGRPVAWRLHDVVDSAGFSRTSRTLVLGAGRLATRIVAVSEAAARPIRDSGIRHVTTFPNSAGFDSTELAQGAKERLRDDLGIPHGATVALFVGRLTPSKGAHIFLGALERCPTLHGLVAGDATYADAEDRTYPARVHEDARHLAGRVKMLGFRRDIPELLGASDFLVVPSCKPDSLPTSILEALACGIPVIASDYGGASEIIGNRRGGILVPPGSAALLADAMTTLATDTTLWNELRSAARARSKDFSPAMTWPRVWGALTGATTPTWPTRPEPAAGTSTLQA